MTIQRSRIQTKAVNIVSSFTIFVNGDAVEDHRGYRGVLAIARSYALYGNVVLRNNSKKISISIPGFQF